MIAEFSSPLHRRILVLCSSFGFIFVTVRKMFSRVRHQPRQQMQITNKNRNVLTSLF
ncbi:hypothetical protein DPEC_G00025000 [Dallia pectoralis]|uniref:Uncharacterized protein n=1 Tax=Dallia pectoralis TaxID=75939 RepID=A0ACC2HHU4_DALPE|nr:hypothetical protein DPEC_G00025000 [Dallia pectoralis]